MDSLTNGFCFPVTTTPSQCEGDACPTEVLATTTTPCPNAQKINELREKWDYLSHVSWDTRRSEMRQDVFPIDYATDCSECDNIGTEQCTDAEVSALRRTECHCRPGFIVGCKLMLLLPLALHLVMRQWRVNNKSVFRTRGARQRSMSAPRAPVADTGHAMTKGMATPVSVTTCAQGPTANGTWDGGHITTSPGD